MSLVKLGVVAALAIFGSTTAFADTSPFTKLSSLPGGGGTIAVDPTAPEKLYMSVGSGKIAHSVDSGAHWKVVQVGPYNSYFEGIAVNPKNPNIVLATLLPTAFVGSSPVGLYQSTNGGESWERLGSQPASSQIALVGSGVIFNTAGTVIVASDYDVGIFRSTDSGNSWNSPLSGHVDAIASDPNKPMSIWAVGRNLSDKVAVWNSKDFGKTWFENDIPALRSNEGPAGFAIQPRSGDILLPYGRYDVETGKFGGGVVLSKDGGKSWEKSSAGLSPAVVPQSNPVFASDDPTTVIFPAYSPGYPQNLFRSINSGKNWNSIGSAEGLAGEDGIGYLATQPAGAKNPAQVLAAGTSFFSSADHGNSWKRQEVGLNAVGAGTIWNDGAGSGGLYALGNTSRLFHSANGGKGWSHEDNWTGSAAVIAFGVDTLAVNHDAYAATYDASGSTIRQSTDLGVSWKTLSARLSPGAYVLQLVVDPVERGRVYVVYVTDTVQNCLLRSDDGGQTWAELSVGAKGDAFQRFNEADLRSLIVPDPGRVGTLYARMNSGLWKSTDSGAGWSKISLSPTSATITGFTIMPGSRETLFAALYTFSSSGGNVSLQKSFNGGATWTEATNPFAANSPSDYVSLVAAPGSRLLAYRNCGTYPSGPTAEVSLSTDGGKIWKLVDQPIIHDFEALSCPTVSVTSHEIYITDPDGTQFAYTAPLGSL